jgi:uncharacterized protein involved in exopolysaccharide biosynthesis
MQGIPAFKRLPRALVARRWLLLVPFAVGLAAAGPLGSVVRPIYRSEAVVVAEPARGGASSPDPVALIKEQILTRPRLESIIADLHLYSAERARASVDDVVARMRSDIDVRPGDSAASVRVRYLGADPSTARRVTERLTTVGAAGQAEPTPSDGGTVALDAEIAQAKERLALQEKKLEQFRSRRTGESRAESPNTEALQRDLQGVSELLAGLRAHRATVERQLADAKSRPAPAPEPDQPPVLSTAAQQLGMAKAQLQLYKLRLPADHPDVVALERTISQIEARVAQESARAPERAGAADPALEKRVRDLQEDLAATDRRITTTSAEEARLRRAASSPPAGGGRTSADDGDLLALTREFAALQTAYSDLLVKRERAVLKTVPVEHAPVVQLFRVVDPASLPTEPINAGRRLTIMTTGPIAGLALGVLLVAFAEVRDKSFKRGADASRVLGLPVLALVPVLASEGERQAARRRALTTDIGGVLALLAAVAVLFFWRAQG